MTEHLLFHKSNSSIIILVWQYQEVVQKIKASEVLWMLSSFMRDTSLSLPVVVSGNMTVFEATWKRNWLDTMSSCILFLGFFFLAYKIVKKKKEIAVVHKLPSLYNIIGVAWIVKICISREIESINKICHAWGQTMCI